MIFQGPSARAFNTLAVEEPKVTARLLPTAMNDRGFLGQQVGRHPAARDEDIGTFEVRNLPVSKCLHRN